MSWPLASFLIVGVVLALGWLAYERARPSARMVAVVATLAAVAALGRDAFVALPDVKPIMAALDETGRGTVVIVGLETDVCVAHTALLLLDRGRRVAVAADCLFSPGEAHDSGLRRLRDGGVEMLSAKAVFYDWVRGLAELDAAYASSETVRRPPGFHL